MRAWLLVLGAAACGGDGKVKPDAFVAPPTLTLYIPETSKNGDCLCFAATG